MTSVEDGGGEFVAGAIALVIGAFGLLAVLGRVVLPINLAVLSVYLTQTGAIVMFAAIAIIGFGLLIGGLVDMAGDDVHTTTVTKEVVVVTNP
jgi:hypothetical protein